MGKGRFYKSDEVKAYEEAFILQSSRYRGKNIEAPFHITIDVYFRSNRSDLGNAEKVILDCLQQCKAIKNDRQCVGLTMWKHIDPENPRVEYSIKVLN